MNNVRHKVLRLKGEYHVQKLFVGQHTKNYHWVAKRYKNFGNTIGPVKTYERLHQALSDIRSEPNGKKSQIELTNAVRKHLITIGFKDSDIDIMIDNTKEVKPNEVTAIS
jgi:hypothetical protein